MDEIDGSSTEIHPPGSAWRRAREYSGLRSLGHSGLRKLGTAATVGGTDALASAALAAPEGGLLAGPAAFTETALPFTSPLLSGAGSVSGVAGDTASGLSGGLNQVLSTPLTTPSTTPASLQPGVTPITTPPPPTPPPAGAGTATPGAAAAAPVAPSSVATPSVADIVSGGGTAQVGGGTGVLSNTGASSFSQTPGTVGGGGLNDILKGAGTTFKDISPFLGPAVSLGGLGLDILRNNQQTPYTSNVAGAAGNINSTARGLVTQGQGLENYLASGTLPPGVQQGLDTATRQAKAAIQSKYAASGESGSSAEAEDLANVDSVAAGQGAQLALNLYNSGVSEVTSGVSAEGASAQLYQYLLQQALTKDQQLGSAIGSFASSLVPATTVKLASAT